MRISELLTAFASWLESPENEALLLAEYDDASLEATAKACVEAANILRKGAAEVEAIEPTPESSITPESLDTLASIADAFDSSDDEDLKKSASVIDELLLTLAVTPNAVDQLKNAQKSRIEELKAKYIDTRTRQRDLDKLSEAEKAVKDSPYQKEYTILEHALSTRTCPDHPGAQMARVGESTWQCDLDKKVFNYATGYTTEKGEKVPGGDVANQTLKDYPDPQSMFDTRESRLKGY